jgi:hypothetical protein
MVGFSFVQNCGGMLKKARLLVILVAAALVLSSAFLLSFDDGSVQVDSSIVGNAGWVTKDTPLPKLSESTAQSSPNPAPSQTDNRTAPASSSGAVKASFTVVTPSASDRGESGTSPTGSVARDSNDASPTASAQVVDVVASDDQPLKNDRLGIAADVRPKSGGLTVGWVLLITAWSAEMALVCVSLSSVSGPKSSLPRDALPGKMH